jgi:quinol monooxygenase YgiN
MPYVITARWVAKEGEEDAVLAAIREVAPLSRAERGCRFFQPNRSPDDPRVFFFYEIYDDAAAAQAHSESEHFQRLVLGQAVPHLESRERVYYETIEV